MNTTTVTNIGRSLGLERKEVLNSMIGFLLWPFGILLASLSYWKKPWSKNAFWLFCIFFGFTFISTGFESDASRYAEAFMNYANTKMTLSQLWQSIYSESTNYLDILQPLIMYLLSRFTGNPNILFGVFSILFGYFYSRNLWYIMEQAKGPFSLIVILYIFIFALFYPVWNIGNFRLLFASQLFIFGILPLLLENDKKKLIWAFLTVFVHFSYFYAVGVLLVFLVMRNRLNLYFIFFLVTSLINEIDLQWVQSMLLAYLPDVFHTRILGYTNLDYVEALQYHNQAYNWYVLFVDKCIQWTVYAFAIFLFVSARKQFNDLPTFRSLFCFALLMYGFGNLASNIPSGQRFVDLASAFMFISFVIFVTRTEGLRWMNALKLATLPGLLLVLIVEMRSGMEFYGYITLLGNPLTATLNQDTLPMIDVLKEVIF